MRRYVIAAVAASAAMAFAALATAQGEPTFYVDTTADGLESADHCANGQPCPLRSAVFLANTGSGGRVTAIRCAQPGEPGCLSTEDPNYDSATDQWTFHLSGDLGALILDFQNIHLDFRPTAPGWDGPEDNAVVIDGGDSLMARAIDMQGPNHLVAGIEFRGTFNNAAVEVSRSGDNIVLGPGLLFADVAGLAAIRIRDPEVETSIVGNWCGLTRDGTVKPVGGACILLDRGATLVTLGGESAAAPNYLVASTGPAVSMIGPAVDRNVIAGNVIGQTPDGAPGAVAGGGVVARDSGANVISANTIAGTGSSGISFAGTSFANRITGNHVGYVPADEEGGGTTAPNMGWGIALTERTAGTEITGNWIQNNTHGGILVSGGQAVNNLISQNRLRGNQGPSIQVSGGANGGVRPPLFSIVRDDMASGTACGGCLVELFSSDDGEAWLYEGSVTAVGGQFLFRPDEPLTGPYLTATATGSGGNTSGMSEAVRLPGAPTPTPVFFFIQFPLVAKAWQR
jgi:hypothetical protein